MLRKKTPAEYIQECKENGYDLPLEDYINAKTKIKHKCKNGHIYLQTPHKHLKGHGCSKCGHVKAAKNRIGKNKKKTPKEYYQECKEKGLDLPIEDYKGNKVKIKHKCSKGHLYKQKPNHHLHGHGCPVCSNKKRKTTQDYYEECKEKGYDLPIEDYINRNTKIYHKCKKGHIYKQTPSSHLNGHGCPKCIKNYLYTTQEHYNYCKLNLLDLPLDTYVNSKTKIRYKCSKNHIYFQRPNDHIHGYGCPICNESHGEKYIRNYLDDNNIKYEPQKRFDDLKDKTYLSYDFYLPKQKILIEYQGRQHYEENNYFGGEEQLKLQQHHDKLKKEYAKKNHYKLLELHYSLDTQDKVDKYLQRRLKN